MKQANAYSPKDQLKALTAEQVNQFWTDGYLPLGKVLNDELVEKLRAEYDQAFALARAGKGSFRNLAIDDTDDLEAKNTAETQMLQIMQMSERSIAYRELLFHQDLLDRVEDLIGPNIQLFHDQALFKPPYHGGPVLWHQDNAYWRCSPPNLISCWMTLDDVTIDNGAMQFIPGSHFRAVDHDRAEATNALLDLGDKVDASQAVAIDLPAGGVTIHHCQTLHYTAPNTTDRQRRAFAIHYMVPGTKRLRTGEYIAVGFSHPMLRMRV